MAFITQMKPEDVMSLLTEDLHNGNNNCVQANCLCVNILLGR